jgi:ELWxxDGT repeat protein
MLSASLVKDLNPTTGGTGPLEPTVVGSTVFFTTRHLDGTAQSTLGQDLWRTDGTVAGTARISYAWRRSGSMDKHGLASAGGRLFYVDDGPLPGSTRQLAAVDPATNATADVTGFAYQGTSIGTPVAVGGTAYFVVDEGTGKAELWSSGGTPATTALVAPADAFVAGSVSALREVNGTLYFAANDGVHGVELWKSDGTAAGTVMVADVNPGAAGSGVASLTAVGGNVYFAANDGSHGVEPWRSDGTAAGTAIVRDVVVGAGGSSPAGLANAGGAVYFAANDGSHGAELWKVDGSGATLVSDAVTGTAGSSPANIVAVNGLAVYTATTSAGGSELWASDGTAAGTARLRDINPGSAGSAISGLTVVGGTAFFSANDGSHGAETWKTDGTIAGTTLVLDVAPGSAGSSPASLVNFGGTTLFVADDATHGTELWASDGTAAGTSLVVDLDSARRSALPGEAFSLGNTAIFTVRSGPQFGVWATDGTLAGTRQLTAATTIATGGRFVNSIQPGPEAAVVGGTLFFAGTGGLWKTDGTPAGTTLVLAMTNSSYPFNVPVLSDLTAVGDRLYFSGTSPVGDELWTSDGTTAGTYLVKDLLPGTTPGNQQYSGSPRNLMELDGKAYFTSLGFLWTTDGTAAGTVKIAPASPGPLYDDIDYAAVADGAIYLVGNNGQSALYRSDGTAAGTVPVAAGLVPSTYPRMVGFDHGVYVAGWVGGVSGLYRVDSSTGAVTSVLATAVPDQLTVVRGSLYFAGDDDKELWTLSPGGGSPTLLRAFAGGVGGIVNAGGIVYFAGADTAATGTLWRTDGTALGTVPALGPPAAAMVGAVNAIVAANDNVMFIAPSAATGTGSDLWWLSNPPTAPAAPNGLVAEATSGTEIRLAWTDNADNEDRFLLVRSLSPTFDVIDGSVVLPANVTSYVDAGLSPNVTYYYRLTATTGPLPSAAATASAATVPAPAAPSALTATAASPTEIDLAWADNASDETGFLLERSRFSNFSTIDQAFNLPANAGAVAAFVDAAAAKNTRYYYRLRAVNDGGRSAAVTATAATPDAGPADPSDLRVVVRGIPISGFSAIGLSWTNHADNAANFVVERRAEPGGTFAPVATISAAYNQYKDESAKAGGRYTYRVRATNAVGPSGPTNEVTVDDAPIGSPVADVNPNGGSNPGSLTAYNGQLYFAAEEGVHGRELWRTDGTAAGTSLVADINPQGASSSPSTLTVVGGTLYFAAYDGAQGGELWKTDGSTAGTTLVKAVPGLATRTIQGLVAGTSTLYFLASADGSTYQLWQSDGTAAGTAAVPGATVSPDFSAPNLGLVTVGDAVYFVSGDPGGAGQEVWRADAAGAAPVADIYPGGAGSGPRNLTVSASSLYFFATDPAGFGLFKTDVASGATTKVYGPFGPASNPTNLLATPAGTLYFEASDQGREQVWRSDGTTAGTVTLASLVPVAAGTVGAAHLTVVGESVYYETYDGQAGSPGPTLYKTDGTPAGTSRVMAVYRDQSPVYLAVGGQLYFYSDGSLIRTDGTAAGTVYVQNVATSPDVPATTLATVGDTLYFSADPFWANRELYKVAVAAPAAPTGLAVALPAVGTAKLTWTDAAGDEAGFWIDRSRTPDFSVVDGTLWAPANATVAFDTGYTPATTNYYRVRAYNAAGESANGAAASLAFPPATTVPQPVVVPPAAVANLQVRADLGQINLIWNDAVGATGYAVERSVDGLTFAPLATVGAAHHYEDAAAAPHVTYWYRVRALNAAGASPYTSAVPASAYTVRPDQLARHIGFDATSGGTWMGRLGDQLQAVAGNAEAVALTGSTTRIWAASTTDPRALQKAVSTTSDRIAAAWSSATSFTITLPVHGNAGTQTLYAVDWDNAGRSERFDLVDATTNTVLDTQTISNFQDGIYLSWNVRGRVKVVVTRLAGPDAVVGGVFGQALFAPNAPTGLVATPAPGSIDLAWVDNSTNEEGTRIERSSDNVHFSEVGTAGPNVTTYSDVTAAAGAIHYYRVRAYNSWSDSAAGTSGVAAAAAAAPTDPADGGSAPSNVVRATALAPHAPTLSAISVVGGSTFVQKVTLTGNYFVADPVVTFVNATTGQTLSSAGTAADRPVIASRTLTGLVVQATFGASAGSWTFTVGTAFGTSNTLTFAVAAAAPLTAAAAADKGKTTVRLSLAGIPATVAATYAWRVTAAPSGAPAATFSTNNTAAAAAAVATLGKAGTYTFAVKVSDGVAAHAVERTVTVTVTAALTTLMITPAAVSVARGAKQQFAVAGRDQFGATVTPLPTVAWAVLAGGAGGTVTSAGLYTAPSGVSGSATVKATAAGLIATAVVTIPQPAFAGAKIDFAPAAAAVASGYQRDAGLVYGARTTALTYGWNVSHAATSFDRNKNSNQLLDTSVGVLAGGKWELAVTNGTYNVKVGVGDSAVATTNTVRVEGASLYAAAKQAANVFSAKTIKVTVTDGRLTIDAGSAASSATRLDYLEVTKA